MIDLKKEREENILLARAQRRADMAEVLLTAAGRRIIWGILETTRLFHDAMTGNSNTFYILGRQSIGKELMGELKAYHFLEWQTMELEHYESKEVDDGNRTSARDATG